MLKKANKKTDRNKKCRTFRPASRDSRGHRRTILLALEINLMYAILTAW